MAYNLGVDLGTTYVAAAVARPTQIEMVTLGDRSVVAPAVVYVAEDGELVTGDAAGRRSASNPDRVGREFKRRLGDPTPVMLGGAPHTVTALLGSLLRDVVTKTTDTEGRPPEHVVLTHPANWGPFRRALFEEVPDLVGLSDVTLITEPEAAAAYYASSRELSEGEIIAVYDLGGGTFDATVLRKRSDGVEILGSPEGIERLGGIDFDEAILSYVNFSAGGTLSELDLADPRTTIALARLRQDCVLAKEALSVDTEVVIPVFLPGRHLDVKLTRAEFEDMARAPIESTIGALARTMRSAGVSPADLSAVLLVGGSSRIPLVAKMVSEELGRPTVVDTHPKYAVALGAASVAGVPTTNGHTGGHSVAGPAAWPASPEGLTAPDPTPTEPRPAPREFLVTRPVIPTRPPSSLSSTGPARGASAPGRDRGPTASGTAAPGRPPGPPASGVSSTAAVPGPPPAGGPSAPPVEPPRQRPRAGGAPGRPTTPTWQLIVLGVLALVAAAAVVIGITIVVTAVRSKLGQPDRSTAPISAPTLAQPARAEAVPHVLVPSLTPLDPTRPRQTP